MPIPLNTDLTPANGTPGIYVQIVTGGSSSADANEASTVLLLGEMLSSGLWAPGGVYDILSEDDVKNGAGGGVAGTGAPTIYRQWRAVQAQVGEGNVRIKACPVLEPSGGTAATYKLSVHVVNTSTLAATTNPTTAGSLRFQICGDEVSVNYATSDTNATIATALRLELLKLKYIPTSIGSLTTATTPLTYNAKGLLGEDMPMRAWTTDGSGVYLSLGSLTYATAGAGAGSAKLVMGTQTVTATIADLDTAATTAAAVKAALLLDDFPVFAGAVATATIPLFMRNGRDVRRMAASIVTTTNMTVRFFDGNATALGAITDGTGSATSFTYNGVQGASLPTLTTALANITLAGSFGEWTCPWNTAGSSSTGLTAIATQIEADANGETQKGQHLVVGSIDAEATAAAIAASVTPVLGSSQRYIIGHCPDAGQQWYELAARRAAMIAAWTTPSTNSDLAWGGTPFQSRGGVPLNLPSQRIRASAATVKAAILDGLEVWGVSGGVFGIIRGRNASTVTERELWDPSYIRQFDYARLDLRVDGKATFTGAKIKADGIVMQSGEITTASVEGWACGRIDRYEALGVYDGAEELKPGVRASINQSDRTRMDLKVPFSPVIMLQQLGVVLARTAPTLP